jgi:hypothetical protein
MFKGLPVVFVKNWTEITPAFLHKKWTSMQEEKKYDWKKRYAPYWISLVFQEFKDEMLASDKVRGKVADVSYFQKSTTPD